MVDNFALGYVRVYLGVNRPAELVTLPPGLRPERRFAPLARGLQLIDVFSAGLMEYQMVFAQDSVILALGMLREFRKA